MKEKMNQDFVNGYGDDAAVYQLTPKGIAYMALMESKLLPKYDWAFEKFERFWDRFELYMYRNGYISNDDDEQR